MRNKTVDERRCPKCPIFRDMYKNNHHGGAEAQRAFLKYFSVLSEPPWLIYLFPEFRDYSLKDMQFADL